MDKILKAILAFLWLVVIVLLIAWFVHAMNTRDFKFWEVFTWTKNGETTVDDVIDSFTWNKSDINTSAHEKDYSISAIKQIEADLVYERLNIEPWNGDTIKVVIESNLSEDKLPKVSSNDRTLKIDSSSILLNKINFGTLNVRTYVTIKVPKSLATGSDLEIDTKNVSGSTTIENLSVKSIEAESTSGSIKVNDCFVKEIDCDSVSGSVTIDNGEYEQVESKTTSGSIKFYSSVNNRFDLETVSGSIKCETKAMPTRGGKAHSISGSVSLYLPKNDGFTLDYSSMSGSVKNSFTGFSGKRNGHDKYKDGNPTFKLETMSGSIKVDNL